MPTSGVHITVVEILARDPDLGELLGSSDDEDSQELAFAKLGAIGPDLFYAMADLGPGLQDIFNFLVKTGGSFECLYSLMKEADAAIDAVKDDATFGLSTYFDQIIGEFEDTLGLVGSTIHTGLLSMLVDVGFNFYPFLEARRQQDFPREQWFWADTFHYVRTGHFAKTLLRNSSGNSLHRAYAMGYATHYVTDVVGHPYINQIVRSPWRMYWQRHHLVENFVDVQTWARWHDRAPGAEEAGDDAPLDTLRSAPRDKVAEGASFTFARLNDHIDIGVVRGRDPVDALIVEICTKIRKGLFDIGLAEKNPDPPTDERLRSWAEFMALSIRQAYPEGARPPTNLAGGDRPDGYPIPDDILSSYSLFRLFLRMSTENRIVEPEFPDIAKDVWDAMLKTWKDLLDDLGGLPNPLPIPGIDPRNVSFKAIWASILDWAKRTVEFAEKLGKAAIHFIRNQLSVVGVLVLDVVKAGLYVFKKALFDIYMGFRHVLVRAGYAIPFTHELWSDLGGGVPATQLWTTPSDNMGFPYEEIPSLQRAPFLNRYVPWVYPGMLDEMRPTHLLEEDHTPGDIYPYRADASAFMEPPLGSRGILSADGPQKLGAPYDKRTFGGAIENCRVVLTGFLDAEAADRLDEFDLPDYNLDGDRGYAWPCWEQRRPPFPDGRPYDPLSPGDGRPVVRVDPVAIDRVMPS